MSNKQMLNILMVDDDHDDVYSTMRMLAGSNITNQFLCETDPDKLFEKLSRLETIGEGELNLIILLDINMPRTSGLEVLKTLKSSEKYKHIPVFMLSTSDDVVDMLDSYDIGADGYLTKPIIPNEMITAVNEFSAHKLQLVQSSA